MLIIGVSRTDIDSYKGQSAETYFPKLYQYLKMSQSDNDSL